MRLHHIGNRERREQGREVELATELDERLRLRSWDGGDGPDVAVDWSLGQL